MSPVWRSAAPLPVRTQELYPAVHQGRLWVAGGIASNGSSLFFPESTWSYDPAQNTWRDEAPMPEPRHHAAMVSTGEQLFVVGGFSATQGAVWGMLDSILVKSDNGWVRHASMPKPQAEGVLAHHADGIVHLATGQSRKGAANRSRSDHTEVRDHWRWDTNTGAWENAAPVPTPRNSATGGWVGDSLIITGGRTASGNLDVTEIYDASEDRWRTGAPMPRPQAGTAGAVIDDSLIVFGGEIFTPESAVFPNVWRYRPYEDTWEALPDMLTPRHGIGAGRFGRAIHVVGGATEPGGRGTSAVNEVLTFNGQPRKSR